VGRKKLLTFVALWAMMLPGLGGTTVSVAADTISRAFGMDLGRVGLLLLAFSSGSLVATLTGGRLSDRLGELAVLRAGALLYLAGSILWAGARSFPTFVAGSFSAGLGGGSLALASVSLLHRLHGERRRFAIAGSQAMVALVYLSAPAGVGWLIERQGGFKGVYVVLVGISSALSLLALSSERSEPRVRHGKGGRLVPPGASGLFLVSFLHVGAEVSVSYWVCMYLARTLGTGAFSSSFGLALYSSGMFLGRLVLIRLPEGWGDMRILKGCVAGAMASLVSVALSSGYVAKLASFFSVGFFIGGDWPTLLTYAGRRFPERTGEATGYLMVGSGLGGLTFPPLMGLLGGKFGAWVLVVGPLVPLVGLMAVAWRLGREKTKEVGHRTLE